MNPHISFQFPYRINRNISFKPVVSGQKRFNSDAELVEFAIPEIIRIRNSSLKSLPQRYHSYLNYIKNYIKNYDPRHYNSSLQESLKIMMNYIKTVTSLENAIKNILQTNAPQFWKTIPSLARQLSFWLAHYNKSQLNPKKGIAIFCDDTDFRKYSVYAAISAAISIQNSLPPQFSWFIPPISMASSPARYIMISSSYDAFVARFQNFNVNLLSNHYNLLNISKTETTIIIP